jgi:hypothetical protein
MKYLEDQTEARNQAIAQRLAYLELSMKKAFAHIENLAHSIATGGTGCIRVASEAKGKGTSFVTIAEQANKYLESRLTPDQIKLIKSVKRDEDTALLRRRVICDLHEKGVSANMIGKILCKDHNTVFYNLVMGGRNKAGNNKQYKARMYSKSNIKRGRTQKKFIDNF